MDKNKLRIRRALSTPILLLALALTLPLFQNCSSRLSPVEFSSSTQSGDGNEGSGQDFGSGDCISGVAGIYPNQPTGFNRVFEHDFSAIPLNNNGIAGSNWFVEDGFSNLSIFTDTTVPANGGDPNCLRTKFPKGHMAGNAPVNMYVDMVDNGVARRTQQYFSLWFMIEGSAWENQAVGTKFGFFGYGEGADGALNQGFLMLRGVDVQQKVTSVPLELWQQGEIADRTIGRNMGSGDAAPVGVWIHLEIVMKDNTIGSTNGELHMWVNGTKTHQYNNVVYRTSKYPLGFRGWKWNPTWGGIGGIKTQDDYIRFAHVYMSGN